MEAASFRGRNQTSSVCWIKNSNFSTAFASKNHFWTLFYVGTLLQILPPVMYFSVCMYHHPQIDFRSNERNTSFRTKTSSLKVFLWSETFFFLLMTFWILAFLFWQISFFLQSRTMENIQKTKTKHKNDVKSTKNDASSGRKRSKTCDEIFDKFDTTSIMGQMVPHALPVSLGLLHFALGVNS